MTEDAYQAQIIEGIFQARWNRSSWLEAPMRNVNVRIYDDSEGALEVILKVIKKALSTAVAERGRALWIGAGGSTPKPVYQRLDTLDLPWDKITLSQVDERFVPLDDASSNTKMIRDAAAPVIGKGMSFVSLIQDLSDASVCAEKAETCLRDLNDGDAPIFDLTLLGMGLDKHYASIFPEHPINKIIYDTERLVLPVEPSTSGQEPKLPRITLSVDALNRSRLIILYITGWEKMKALEAAIENPDPNASPIGAFLAQCPAPVHVVLG